MKCSLFLLFCLMSSPAFAQQDVWFVNDDAVEDGDGTSWGTAFRYLQDALLSDDLDAGDEVRVAQGTYFPDLSENHTGSPDFIVEGDGGISFTLITGVAIRGGFRGPNSQELDPNEQGFVSILSGDLGGDDDPDEPFDGDLTDDNSYHVVRAEGVGASAILDGFTIKGGNATNHTGSATECAPNQTVPNAAGGGLFCRDAGPTIRNCVFESNHALAGGAIGLYCSSDPDIINCLFEGNLAYNPTGSNPTEVT